MPPPLCMLVIQTTRVRTFVEVLEDRKLRKLFAQITNSYAMK